MLYADVIVKQRTNVEELTYAVPAAIVPYIRSGSLVTVPLRRRIVRATVVGLKRAVRSELKGKIREIATIERDRHLTEEEITVMREIAAHYGASMAEVAFHALRLLPIERPQTSRQQGERPVFVQAPLHHRLRAYSEIFKKLTAGQVMLIVCSQQAFARAVHHYFKKAGASTLLHDDTVRFRRRFSEVVALGPVVIITTPAGLFFPLRAADVIVVDDASHFAHKQRTRPFLTSATVARIRARYEHLSLVLADAIPGMRDVISIQRKEIALNATFDPPRQPVTLISRTGNPAVLVPSFVSEISAAASQGRRVLVIALARGWATALFCRNCATLVRCPECRATLLVEVGAVNCRRCGYAVSRPAHCAACRSSNLVLVGEGVARVASELRRGVPEKSVTVFSSDQPEFTPSEIVVATEKITALPPQSFDVVACASVDRLITGLEPDDRWSLLRLVRSQTGRETKLIVQTFFPDDLVWSAMAGNVRSFFTQELTDRKRSKVPPFTVSAAVVGSGAEVTLSKQVDHVRQLLAEAIPGAQLAETIFRPIGRGEHQAVIKVLCLRLSRETKRRVADGLPPAWHWDIEASQ